MPDTTTTRPPFKVSFGLFEVDFKSGELRRSGIRIKLQGQPFKVLSILLEQPGEVVSREEIQQRLWGKGTNVDFDHSLGTAINKIRDALGDSADNPRFIETLARRGYRFIAPVTPLDPATSPDTLASTPADTATDQPASLAPPHHPATPIAFTSVVVHPRSPAETLTLPAEPLPEPSPAPTKKAPHHTFALTRTQALRLLLLATSVLLLIAAVLFLWTRLQPSPAPYRITQITHSGRVSPGLPELESLSPSATDNSRLYFSQIVDGRSTLAQSFVTDGEVVSLDVPSQVEAPVIADISPASDRLLLNNHLASAAEQPLWIAPIQGGSARRIGNILAHDATWMPDGQRILYASGNGLFLTDEQGHASTPFATLPGRAFWLRWAPDATRLRFTLRDPVHHTSAIWEIASSGRNPHPVFDRWSTPASECCGSWTGDGSRFIFQSRHDGRNNLWMTRETGLARFLAPGPRQLTNGPLSYQAPITPRIGQQVYFIGVEGRTELVTPAPDKSLLPLPASVFSATRINYSRDGQWVAWVDREGTLWRSRTDGSERLQLTEPPLEIFLMRWSPDNQQIVLMAREPGRPWQLYLVPATGGDRQPLLPEDRNQADPDWSPDGKSIVFGRVPDLMAVEPQPKSIQVLNLATHALTTLPNSTGLASPRWSPDGRYILASSLDQRRLLLFNTATRTWAPLADVSVADPVWAHDSQSVFFHNFAAPGEPIQRVSLPNGHLDTVISLSDLHFSDAVDFSFAGLLPGDRPALRTRIWTANFYSLQLDR